MRLRNQLIVNCSIWDLFNVGLTDNSLFFFPLGISASEIVTDRLEAKSAVIDELQVNKPVVTQRGDIAYHFRLKKAEHDPPLEEGDIAGVFEAPDGKTYIEKLTHFNASKAKMAGVISRSAYLVAKTPAEDEDRGKDSSGSARCCFDRPPFLEYPSPFLPYPSVNSPLGRLHLANLGTPSVIPLTELGNSIFAI